MSENNEKVFHTIGEVSKSVDVAQHVLRFWEEKFSQVKPIKRKGRRLYNKSDIELIKRIKHLLYEKGYTTRGVQREIEELKMEEQVIHQADADKSLSRKRQLMALSDELASIQEDLIKIADGA